MSNRIFYCVTIFIFQSLCANANTIEHKIDHLASEISFSGSILISKEGEIIHSKGYGMANYEHDVKNNPHTKYRLSSVTKQFTSMAIMILQERGKLNIADSIYKYLPNFPKKGSDITIKHLMSHRAGIPEYMDYLTTFRNEMNLENDLIGLFKDKPLNFIPGSNFEYSNSGYLMLGSIIENVSKQSYEDFLKENIFNPLGMKNTGYYRTHSILKHRSSGYRLNDKNKIEHAEFMDDSIPYSAGGLYSTVRDLSLWDQALRNNTLITEKSKKRMFEKAYKGSNLGYGLGWIIEDKTPNKAIWHGGSLPGFTSIIIRYIDDKATIIVLSNFEDAEANIGLIREEIEAILFEE